MAEVRSLASKRYRSTLSGMFASVALSLLTIRAAHVFGENADTPPAPTLELPVAELVTQLFKQIHTESAERIWEPVNRLVRLGRTSGDVVTDRLEKELQSKDTKIQLACARALSQLNKTERAGVVLGRIVQYGESAELRQLAANAIGLTTPLYGDEEIAKALEAALNSETDDNAKISIARSLWRVTSKSEGKEALLKILNNSTDKKARDESALVLAENGLLHMPDVRLRLLNLYSEPTPQGERAFNLLRRAEEENSRTEDSKEVQGEQLMHELMAEIQRAYPDETKADPEKLYEFAAKGMIASLDPFSEYMDRDEVKATQEMLQQDYGGIGAYVGVRNSLFVVTSPIYGAPADKAGLKALDIIQEVDGQKANELMDKGGLNGVIARLKGKPGTTVKLKYYRRGFYKPIEVSIVRETIRVDTVMSAMLPGDIGYIRLTRFGEHSAEEMQATLDTLKQKNSKAIILDLRNNPGGLLNAGVEIAAKFLHAGRLVVYSQGKKDFAPYHPYFSKGEPENEEFPLVLLVGAGSASASEIVAGAMQDHKRAVLVGEKTYGKGSVQQIIPVHATGRETQVRMTIAKYYLPSGRCIHGKGVDVDVEIKPPEQQGWVVEQLVNMRRDNLFDEYVRTRWENSKDLFVKLSENDDQKSENWPGFDEFYKGLKTRIEPDEIRAELRYAARRRVQDELKREFVYDLEEDLVLQRGVLEALKGMKVEPSAIAEYKALPDKFKKKPEAIQEGAMLKDAVPPTP